MAVFMIIRRSDPIYELDVSGSFSSSSASSTSSNNNNQTLDMSYLHQFILHSSLDMVQSSMWTNSATFLKAVDRFNNMIVSCYVTIGGATFLLLHTGKNEDTVKMFFLEVSDIYIKYLMNPLISPDAPILSPHFDNLIRNVSKRILGVA